MKIIINNIKAEVLRIIVFDFSVFAKSFEKIQTSNATRILIKIYNVYIAFAPSIYPLEKQRSQ